MGNRLVYTFPFFPEQMKEMNIFDFNRQRQYSFSKRHMTKLFAEGVWHDSSIYN